MIAQRESWSEPAKLEQAIRHRIVERTAGRIRALEVEVFADHIDVRGRAASFHLKQLALQGIVDVIGSVARMRIELEIQVEVNLPRSDAESE